MCVYVYLCCGSMVCMTVHTRACVHAPFCSVVWHPLSSGLLYLATNNNFHPHKSVFSHKNVLFPFFFFTFSFTPLSPSPQKCTNKCWLHCPFWQVIVRNDSWFCCDITCIWTHLQYQWKSGDQYTGKQRRVWSNVINAIRYVSRTWGHSGIDCFYKQAPFWCFYAFWCTSYTVVYFLDELNCDVKKKLFL